MRDIEIITKLSDEESYEMADLFNGIMGMDSYDYLDFTNLQELENEVENAFDVASSFYGQHDKRKKFEEGIITAIELIKKMRVEEIAAVEKILEQKKRYLEFKDVWE